MKKLLLLLSILTFSLGAFAAGADLCDAGRDKGKDIPDITCPAGSEPNAAGDGCVDTDGNEVTPE